MGIPVLIMGKSGSGKSTSLRNFKDNIGVINVLGKPLPFRNTLPCIKTDDYTEVMKTLVGSKADSIVIDDAGYLMTNQFMRGHAKSGAGNAIFSFYNDIGDSFWNLIQFIIHKLSDKKIVYLLIHEEQSDFGAIKPKSIGKMLDEKVCIEGMFTIVLRAMKNNGEYVFRTQSDGLDVSKTPMGMFADEQISNDLKMVDDTIREYYNLKNESEDK